MSLLIVLSSKKGWIGAPADLPEVDDRLRMTYRHGDQEKNSFKLKIKINYWHAGLLAVQLAILQTMNNSYLSLYTLRFTLYGFFLS